MPIRDVTVTINLLQPAGITGFGKPLILGTKTGGAAYKEYSDLAGLTPDFAATTEVYKAAAALLGQGANSPASFAVVAYDGTSGDPVATLQANWDRDWYFLIATESDVADIKLIADVVEGKGFKMFATRTDDTTDLVTLKAQDYDRTFVIYHSSATEVAKYPDAAWVGARGSSPVGSVTWKFAQLVGITADTIGKATVESVDADGGNVYVMRGGQPRTGEGKTVSGEFIDVIMSKDWVKLNIENSIQTLLNNNPKVPYTNSGIGQLEGATINVLKAGHNQGIIAEDDDGIPLYSTNFPSREQSNPADRAARKYTGATFTFQLAGAVHEGAITGTITV
ncbi:MAG: hypothetical protein K0Q94_555 [Paenibacillus sp.]|jgi:hypothetical protein|nr:hypothetical protein [Paenibacillus sp.]